MPSQFHTTATTGAMKLQLTVENCNIWIAIYIIWGLLEFHYNKLSNAEVAEDDVEEEEKGGVQIPFQINREITITCCTCSLCTYAVVVFLSADWQCLELIVTLLLMFFSSLWFFLAIIQAFITATI